MRGCVVRVWCWRAAGCRVGRPFSGGRHGHVARRAGRDRGASGAGDAVNGKYEKKTVTVDTHGSITRFVWAHTWERSNSRIRDGVINDTVISKITIPGGSRRYQPWVG